MPLRLGRTNIRDEESRSNMDKMLSSMARLAYAVIDKKDEVEFKKLFNEVVNAFLRVYSVKLDDAQINRIVGF